MALLLWNLHNMVILMKAKPFMKLRQMRIEARRRWQQLRLLAVINDLRDQRARMINCKHWVSLYRSVVG